MRLPLLLLLVLMMLSPVALAQKKDSSQGKSASQTSKSKSKQKGPALEETLTWLKENIPTLATYNRRSGDDADISTVEYRVESVQFEGCVMSLTAVSTIFFSSDKKTQTTIYKLKADLSLLDSSRKVVKTLYKDDDSIYFVEFPTLNDQPGVQKRIEFNGDAARSIDEPLDDEIEIFLNEKGAAERVASALTQAITLCQGK